MGVTCPLCGQTVDRPDPKALLAHLPLSDHERVVADLLVRNFGQTVSTERLLDATYADDPDGGPETADKALSCTIWQLRKKLHKVGMDIVGKSHGRNGGGSRRMTWL